MTTLAILQKENMKYPISILQFSNVVQGNVYSTQKPVELLEYPVETYTHSGKIVLDSCMGSSSTGIASIHLGCHFIGMELRLDYFKIAAERLNGSVTA